MLTIRKAAQVTGVSEHTLRAWERRYGIFEPVRTETRYRLYDEDCLATIRAMHSLVAAGWSPRAAAAELGGRVRQPAPVPPPSAQDPFAGLVRAASDLDPAAIAAVMDEQFARAEYENVVDGWLMPALVRLGQEWAAGRISVAEEHLVSAIVMRRLSAAFDAAGRGQPGTPILVGAPSGVEHELGLLAFAVAARRAGVPTTYLGAQVPLEDLRQAALKAGVRHCVTAVHRRRDVARVQRLAATLFDGPGVTTWVGGSAQSFTTAPCRPLGHSIAAAAQAIAGECREDAVRVAAPASG